MKKRMTVAGASLLCAALTACAGGGEADGDVDAFLGLFSTANGNYLVAESPAELSEWSDVILRGTVDEFIDGRTHNVPSDDPEGGIPTVTMVVTPTEVLKGAPLVKRGGGQVYVEVMTAEGAQTDEYNQYVPRDGTVLLYLSSGLAGGMVKDPKNRPNGEPLFSPVNPQGLLMQTGSGDSSRIAALMESEAYDGTSLEDFIPTAERFPAAYLEQHGQ